MRDSRGEGRRRGRRCQVGHSGFERLDQFGQLEPDRYSHVADAGPRNDTLDAIKALEICSRLSPVVHARQVAIAMGEKPAEIPMEGGFIRLSDVPTE